MKKLYEIITPISSGNSLLFQQPFSSFRSNGIENFYLDFLGKTKIFRTVCDAVVSLNDKPKFIDGMYPSSFKGEGFENLLVQIDNLSVVGLIKRYFEAKQQNYLYSEMELLDVINKQSCSWDISQQVEVFIWWNGRNYKSLPKLLKNGKDEWLNYQDDCYFLVGSFEDDFVPEWASIPALKLAYQKELLKQSDNLPKIVNVKTQQDKQQTPRIISQYQIFPSINFKYLDKSTVISPVNSSVNTYEIAVKFVQWLWRNYNDESWNPQEELSFNFPALMKNGDKTILQARKIFFGTEYNNSLSESLFNDAYGKFPSQSELGISDISFVEFAAKFGVKNYPSIQKMEIKNVLPNYERFYQKVVKDNGDIGASKSIFLKFSVPYIESLDGLLKNLDTEKIVKWIEKDKNLYAYISNPIYNDSEAEIKYMGNLQKGERRLKYQVKNYILESFNEIPWIQKDGKRYSPKQMLKGGNSKTNHIFSELLPIIESDYISSIAQKLELKKDIVSDIFSKFDFCTNPTELSSEQFYGLMLKISELPLEKGEKLSRNIYRIVEQPDFCEKYEDSTNLRVFKENGKILVKYKDVIQFYKANQSYLPSSKIVNKKDFPIIEKSQRSGNNQNFKRIFGCKEYDQSYEIVDFSLSGVNGTFQNYFKDFKKYAQAYASRNRNIADVGPKLNVLLVNKIKISINGKSSFIEDEFIPVRKSESFWYISYFSSVLDLQKLSLAIESIYENISNTALFDAGKIGELFREKDPSNREFLIKKEFGSLDIIDDKNYANEIKNDFIATIRKLSESYDVENLKIDFENFESDYSIDAIIRTLNELTTDIEQFQKSGFSYAINLIPFHKSSLQSYISAELMNVKNYLYTQTKKQIKETTAIDDLKKMFLDEFYRFVDFSIEDIPNSIYFNVESLLKEKFGDWTCCKNILSADTEYSSNYELMNPENKFSDDISSNQVVQTMIYFKREEEFKKWLKEKDTEQSHEKDEKDVYGLLRNVTPIKKEVDYRPGTKFEDSGSKKRKHGAFNKKGNARRERNQKIAGNKGELLVYNLLCENFGKENVFPKSEAYVDLKILKPGQADSSCGFDISYKNEHGNEFYVEVKTGDSQSFIVSPEELEYAKSHADKYKLFYVYDLDKEQPSYHELPQKFWEDKRYEKNEIVERIEFRF